MAGPDLHEYPLAVQNPRVAFADPRLASTQPALDRHGIPLKWSGGFAVAFRLESRAGALAVRCFSDVLDDRGERYRHISQFLAGSRSPFTLQVEYLPRGVLVNGSWWPITVMPWINGLTLNDWTEANLHQPSALSAMRGQIVTLLEQLESAGAAHGDLQHGNVIVSGTGHPVLIDYDGMFVPSLAGWKAAEAGHPNYQHPERGQDTFGPSMDRFSAISIWTALRVLELRPDLWDGFNSGENLLFTAKDYADPQASDLLRELKSDAKTNTLAANLERVASASLRSIPSLPDFLAGHLPEVRVQRSLGFIAPYPVLDLRRPIDLASHTGRVIAVGQVKGTDSGVTRDGEPYQFIDIGSPNQTHLKVVLWAKVLAELTASQRQRLKAGLVVAVTGLLEEWGGTMQIALERAVLLELPTKSRVRELLGGFWEDTPLAGTTGRLAVGAVVDHDRFGQGVVLAIERDNAEIRFPLGVKLIKFSVYPMRVVKEAPGQIQPRSGAEDAKPAPKSSSKPAPPRPAPPSPRTPPAPSTQYQKDMADWLGMAGQARPTTGRAQPRGTVRPHGGAQAKTTKPRAAAPVAQPRTAAQQSAPGSAPQTSTGPKALAIVLAVALVIGAIALAVLLSQPAT